jgi:HK97 family phage prohead protease
MWREVFSRNAFDGIETENKRIPVNREHNPQLFCGKVMTSSNHDDGLITEIRISRTELGDETLRMAADDDLAASAGFFLRSHNDQKLDRVNKIRRINRASLDHIALTGSPAYTGTKVLAMRNSEDSQEAHLPTLTSTPNMDRYINDPILRWAADTVLD